METILRRQSWALDLLVIGCCALMLAHAASLALDWNPILPATAPHRTPVRENSASTPPEPIVARNLFCSSCKPSPPDLSPAPAAPQRTTLPLAIIAIMYAPPPLAGRWSVAIVRDTERRVIHVVGADDPILDATIVEVGETRLRLRRAGRMEFLDLLEGGATSVAEATPLPATDPLARALESGVRQTGARSYELERATLESVLSNTNALVRGARIVPEVREGRAAGFRFYQVRPDGPFARIGLRSGDVVSAINGLDLTSTERAVEAYVKLRSASHVSLGLERDGRAITLDYGIR
jgi:general secretion pathway protein C